MGRCATWSSAPPSASDAEPSLIGLLSVPTLASRLKAATLLLIAGMLVVGCMAWHPHGAASYGPQNMAGGSALRSIITGEAADFDAAMEAREQILNDATLTDVSLAPITDAPANFMGDALGSDNLDYVLSLFAEYYNKATVRVAETETNHAP